LKADVIGFTADWMLPATMLTAESVNKMIMNEGEKT